MWRTGLAPAAFCERPPVQLFRWHRTPPRRDYLSAAVSADPGQPPGPPDLGDDRRAARAAAAGPDRRLRHRPPRPRDRGQSLAVARPVARAAGW